MKFVVSFVPLVVLLLVQDCTAINIDMYRIWNSNPYDYQPFPDRNNEKNPDYGSIQNQDSNIGGTITGHRGDGNGAQHHNYAGVSTSPVGKDIKFPRDENLCRIKN